MWLLIHAGIKVLGATENNGVPADVLELSSSSHNIECARDT